ncbi:hypothetical protein DT019_03350 [Streptomyces sp. SDr-06]|uniref:hypothetical protein n=1 Tax=Streptomyces sp. SDr-06 TaxID=2267702 RepID=UPI000DE8CDD3|nr:hypothetical protein [Streptomyces sp. SDr-06]RCH70540.1 hypothetical protein DT019_03350 [Streptomyces sp. SDr-06]
MSISTTPEFKQLVMALDERIPAEAASDLLHAFYEAVRTETRRQVAADFELVGRRQESLTWGQAVMVAREGLCQCQGGSVPCPKPEAGAR